jgi:hypothetical protein
MNALSMSDPLEQQSQASNDACPPTSAGSKHQNGLELISQERMSVLGLEGPGLPLAPPPGRGRLREALNALLRRWSVTTRPLLPFLRLRVPLQRVRPVLLERWMAAVVRMQQARQVLLERWMAADFRTRQLPILAMAAAIWTSTAWMAWRADDSATPLLRQRLAAAKSQSVHPVDLGRGGPSRMMAGPADPQHAVRPGSLTQQTSPSLSLNQIMEFLISGATPRHERLANPRVQVWADTHTGLYYCPAVNGYRRSSRGRFMSQQEAQDNYFQPASGAACP